MKSFRLLVVPVILFLASPVLLAVPRSPSCQDGWGVWSPARSPRPEVLASAGDEKDPGYKFYKAGYKYILDEKWDEARKQFSEVITKHPKSSYLDACRYWTAFALKHTDRKKAIDAYKKFVADYPHSDYYDDAVADLSQLDNIYVIDTAAGKSGTVVRVGRGEHGYDTPRGMVVGTGPSGLGVGFDRSMRKMSRSLTRMSHRFRMVGVPALPAMPFGEDRKEELDPQTKLKMEALYALAESPEDSSAFGAVKDIVVDRHQPMELRSAALDVLSEFNRFDLLPVYLEIAKTDTSEELQTTAIDCIGDISMNKNKAVETLSDLYRGLPTSRMEQRSAVLASIAEIGNDKAIDFLARVARTDENYDVRSDAVYYLGSIGGEKARAALYDILRGK